MNLLKNNNKLLYLGRSCRDVLCSADRNAHMDSVRDDISTLLLANKNQEPLQNMLFIRDETVFGKAWKNNFLLFF